MAAAAVPTDPVSAIAEAFGKTADMVGDIVKSVGSIIRGRDQDFTNRNAYEFGYRQMEFQTNAQRLQYLQSAQSQSTKTLLIISSLMAVIILSFAFLHKHK